MLLTLLQNKIPVLNKNDGGGWNSGKSRRAYQTRAEVLNKRDDKRKRRKLALLLLMGP